MSAVPRSTIVALGTAQTLAWGSTYYLPAILAVPIARDLGIATAWVYGAFSTALLLGATLGPTVGRHIDRRGGRAMLTASSIVLAAGLALLATASGPITLVAAWLVIGAGMAMGLYEAAFATLAAGWRDAARPAITGITLFAGFASTVAWPITGALEGGVGWRGTCLIWAAAHLVIGLPLNRLMPGSSAPVAAPAPGDSHVATTRTMALLSFTFAVGWFSSTAMAAHLPRLLESAGASPTAALAAASLVGPAQVAGRLVEAGFLHRFHPLLSARLAVLAHPLAVVGLTVLGAPAAALFTLLHGAGNGILTIATGTLPLALLGPAGYGLRQGILAAPGRLAQASAPLAFGLALDHLGLAALALTAALGLAACAALLALNPNPSPAPT